MRKKLRQVVFVCSSISQSGELINKIIEANSVSEASLIFFEQYSLKAKEILGPFYRKKTQILENTRTLKFSNQSRKAIYNDWIVNALFLKEPENYAYLVFIKRVDNKKMSPPKGTITVPISDLRFLPC